MPGLSMSIPACQYIDSMISSNLILMAKILLDRLERISADSSWAHQASGIRASLAKTISVQDPDLERLSSLLDAGFLILENAAGEIPE